MSEVHVHVDRLVLEGVALSRRDEAGCRAAFEQTLGRLLAEGGLPILRGSPASVPALQGSMPPPARNGDPARLGSQVATATFAALGGRGAP
jgi:hypothetical protein